MPRLPRNQYDVACRLEGDAFFRVTSRKDVAQTPAMIHEKLTEVIGWLEEAFPDLRRQIAAETPGEK